MTTVPIPPHLAALKPYKPGKPVAQLAREKNLTKIVKLASNENPLGPSPKALEAMRAELSELHRYPEASAYDLVHGLAAKYGRSADRFICTAGADSTLNYIVMAYSSHGDEVLTSEGAFVGFSVGARRQGRQVRLVPQKDYRYDLQAMAAAISKQTRIVYIANPNNPTGSMVTKDELDAFLEKVGSDTLIVLDEAYVDYAKAIKNYPNGMDYQRDNLLVVRTLSKSCGLAGVRVGFATGPVEIIESIKRVKLPFEPNNLAQVGALAALGDDDFVQATVELNHRMLEKMRVTFDQLGVRYVPTATNFLMLLFDNEKLAVDFHEACLDEGLILRYLKPFGFSNAVRINSGNEEETEFALEVIAKVKKSLGF